MAENIFYKDATKRVKSSITKDEEQIEISADIEAFIAAGGSIDLIASRTEHTFVGKVSTPSNGLS